MLARSWGRVLGVLAVLVVLLVVAVAWRAASEAPPPTRIARALATSISLPGRPPVLAWPSEGEAAVQVEGVAGAFASSGARAPVPIASVAKVMTAYLTLLAHPLAPGQQGFKLTITPVNVGEEGQRVALDQSVLPVRSGERITERQALQALLLPSANNIAWLLAEHEGGLRAFVARMNETAKRLGMSATTYTDPSGFTPTTVSSASDQLRLARAAMRLPVFAELANERSARLPVAGRVLNYNALVGEDGYVGVKTGSDDAAGGCLMFAKRALVAGRHVMVLGVVLGQRAGPLVEAALFSARRLGDSAARALRMETVLPAGSRVLDVSAADGRRTFAASAQAMRALGWGGMSVRVNVAVAPSAKGNRVRAGQRLASVSLEGIVSPSVTAALATRALGGPSLGWRLSHLF